MHRKSDSKPTYPDSLEEARRHAREMPLDALDVSDWSLFRNDTLWPYFERLRNEDPVHFHRDGWAGPYWSVTGFHDIKAVEANHEVFSSRINITIVDQPEDFLTPSFIAMDPPEHDVQRKAVNPGGVAAQPDAAGADHPWERDGDPGRPAYRRDLRLGRYGVHRADHADAGDPVRLSRSRSAAS